MSSVREVSEGKQEVGESEEITFALSTTNVGGSPSGVSAVAKLENGGWIDVTSAVFPTNSPTVASDVITLSPFIPGTAFTGKVIRIEVKYTSAGNVLETYIRVEITR